MRTRQLVQRSHATGHAHDYTHHTHSHADARTRKRENEKKNNSKETTRPRRVALSEDLLVHGRVRLVIPRVLRHVAGHGDGLGRRRRHLPRAERRRHGGWCEAGSVRQVMRVMRMRRVMRRQRRWLLVLGMVMVVTRGRALRSGRRFAGRLRGARGVWWPQRRRARGTRRVGRVRTLVLRLGGTHAARSGGRAAAPSTASSAASPSGAALLLSLEHLLVFGAPVLEPDLDLRLRESQGGGELGALWQGEVLGSLEPPVELLKLEARVDGAGLAHLLSLAVHPQRIFQLGLVVPRW